MTHPRTDGHRDRTGTGIQNFRMEMRKRNVPAERGKKKAFH